MEWDILLDQFFWISVCAAMVRIAAPILMAALGEVFAEQSGVLNIGLEGMMLMGAFSGFMGAFLTGNNWLGLLAGMLVGGALSLILVYMSVNRGVDQVVTGIAINIFALGVTGFLFSRAFEITFEPPRIHAFKSWPVPVLSELSWVGPVLFRQTPLVYIALLLVPVCAVVLYRTKFGLKIRAVGEHPLAADTAGVQVNRIRFVCILLSGLMAGFGGAILSVGQVDVFLENMTAGRGFIALAVVVFGKWNPFRVLGAAFLFGLADAFQLRIQALGFKIPFQFLLMAPYVLTIVVLVGVVGKADYPAATGIPYLIERRRRRALAGGRWTRGSAKPEGD
ncbi:MAG: ABC transporter permease [Nitrospinota bacterium]